MQKKRRLEEKIIITKFANFTYLHPIFHASNYPFFKILGAIAQLAERLHRIQEAGGATPPSSIFVDFLD